MTLDFSNLFKAFALRESELKKVTRYNIYATMFYRTNLVIHSHRVSWIIRELNPYAEQVFGKNYDPVKAEIMGLVHDDAEIVMGDIQAGYKYKMSVQQLSEVDKLEENAIDILAQKFPRQVGNYPYRQLLQESFDHSSLESQVMQFADKFDALGEALHEVYAGNRCFMTNIKNEYGLIDLPVVYYYRYFSKFFDKFPAMAPLLKTSADWFKHLPEQNFLNIVEEGIPHTADSIKKPKNFLPYDLWIGANLKYADPEQLAKLYHLKES